MADPPASPTFSDLPTAMKANVFAYIGQKSDQAAVCFVSREWKDIMAPMFWETFVIASDASSERQATLLDPRNAIIPYVRRLVLERGQMQYDSQCPSDLETTIQLIIGALPKDNLRTFANQLAIAPFLLHRLQRQAMLEEISIRRIHFTNNGAIDFRAPMHAPWVLPSLVSIKSMMVVRILMYPLQVKHTLTLYTNNLGTDREGCRNLQDR
jgi:hypothetical protein